jgi:hypothetical protein
MPQSKDTGRQIHIAVGDGRTDCATSRIEPEVAMNTPVPSATLHSGLPTDCATANTIADRLNVEYPGIAGTGFFARLERKVFYFTALHCLRSGPANPAPALPTLMIPYRHTGQTASPNDFVQFEAGYTLEQYVDGTWDDSVDLLACPVKQPARTKDYQHLLARSAKLPSQAEWLDEFVQSEEGERQISAGNLAAVVIGFPRESPNNVIHYGSAGVPTSLQTEAVVVSATVSRSSQPDCLSVTPIGCAYAFPGFSGAPVFARIASRHGPQYALLGMVLCGSSTVLHVLTVGKLLEAAVGDAQ